MYFAKDFKIKAALKFEFGCGFYFCVISALKYIIGLIKSDIICIDMTNVQ